MEVSLAWGDSLLCYRTLRPKQRFEIGPDVSRADFVIPGERHTVTIDRAGDALVVSPDGATVVRGTESAELSLGALTLSVRAASDAPPRFPRVSRAWRGRVAVVCGALAYAAAASAVTALPGSLNADWNSLSQHVGHRAPPDVLSRSNGGAARASWRTSPDWRPWVRAIDVPAAGAPKLIVAETPAAERSAEVRLAGHKVPRARADQRLGGGGARALRGEGPMGNPSAPRALGTWSVTAPRDRDRVVARHPRRTLAGAGSHSLASIGRVAPGSWGSAEDDGSWSELSVPTDEPGREAVDAPFGEQDAHAEDDADILGNTFGPEPEDPLGGGLALRGLGPGGGGARAGIGLGRSGPLGRGAGAGSEQGTGVVDAALFERRASLAAHHPRAPQPTLRVSRDVVARVMARNAGRLLACTRGLAPSSVTLSFRVDATGTASGVVVRDEGLPATTARCLERTVSELEFLPAPGAATSVIHRVQLR